MLDLLENFRRDESVSHRVAVGKPHDALAVPQEFAQAPDVESGLTAPSGVDLREIVGERVASGAIDLPERTAELEAHEVFEVAAAFDEFGQDKEFPRVAQGDKTTLPPDRSDIERSHVAREPVEGVVGPELSRGAIGRVLVAERARRHGLDDRAAMNPSSREVDQQRHTVTVAFHVAPAPERRDGLHVDVALENSVEVPLEILASERGHGKRSAKVVPSASAEDSRRLRGFFHETRGLLQRFSFNRPWHSRCTDSSSRFEERRKSMYPSLWKKEQAFPFFGLRRDFDKLFGDFMGDRFPAALWENGKEVLPAMDVRETDEALIVEAELPGLKPNEYEVKVEEGVLSICAERKQEKDEKTGSYHRMERYYGRMERQFALPANIEAEKVEAAYKDGILMVTLPKKAGAKPKTITVKVK